MSEPLPKVTSSPQLNVSPLSVPDENSLEGQREALAKLDMSGASSTDASSVLENGSTSMMDEKVSEALLKRLHDGVSRATEKQTQSTTLNVRIQSTDLDFLENEFLMTRETAEKYLTEQAGSLTQTLKYLFDVQTQ